MGGIRFSGTNNEQDMAEFVIHTEVKHYLERGFYHLDTIKRGKPRKRTIRRASKQFIVEDGLMYYKGKNSSKRLVVMNMMQKEAILRDSHDNAEMGQHQGRHRMYCQITASYYWLGIASDIIQWIARCPRCQRSNNAKTEATKMHPVSVGEPWTVVAMDLMRPYPVSLQGNSHMLTMTDLFTKWVIAEPLQSPTAQEVAAVLIKTFFEFGPVESIITDQKREFVDQVNKDIFEVFGVCQCVTSSYNSQSKELVDRTNNTIKRTMSMFCNAEQNDWDLHLKRVMYSINTSAQDSMKVTPFSVMFNRHPLIPETLDAVQAELVIDNPELGTETKISEVLPINAKVLYNTEKTTGRQKPFQEHKENRKSFHIHEEKEVQLENRTGPFLVRNISSPGLVTQVEESSRSQKATVSCLKPNFKCEHELDAGTKKVHTTDHGYSKKADGGDASV